MKKILPIIIVLVIIGAIVWKVNNSLNLADNSAITASSTPSIPENETAKVSDKLSEYKNNELGFSVIYPTAWERGESPSSVTFVIPSPTDKEKNTIRNLEAKIDVTSGKCAFPPVTTVKERDTAKVGDLSFNMISIANTVQGTSYFNRMYSLQKDSVCYFFTFTSIVSSPSSKGYTGTTAQKVSLQNKTLIDTADSQFKDMVKSFKFVVGPPGEDETKVSPKKK